MSKHREPEEKIASDKVVITFSIPKKLHFLKGWLEKEATKEGTSVSAVLTRKIICSYIGSGHRFPSTISKHEILEKFGKLFGLTK